jgi:putative ABC transport system permease protein
MTAVPVLRAASGGVRRRRTHTMVILLVLLISTAAATLSLGLLAASNGPFRQAFAAQHGADLMVLADSAKVSDAQLTRTGRLSGVTHAAGPFAVTATTISYPAGDASAPATVVGRASAGGPVDDLVLQDGRWATRPGQVVLSSNLANSLGLAGTTGTPVTVTTAAGAPRLDVVGIASSATYTADAWVVPAEVVALRAPRTAPAAQMLYQFTSAASAAQLHADQAAIAAALPAGAVTGTTTWLTAQSESASRDSIVTPFVEAFAILGLAMAALIVANVVGGAVTAGYRRIGVLKSIGFTPAQVAAAYLAWIGVPALIGCLAGVVLGNFVARPVLRNSAAALGAGGQSVPIWADIAAPIAMIALAGVAALIPAVRAARLSAVAAIASGQAPEHDHGPRAQRLIGRLRLPRSVTLGIAAPFARPARTAVTAAAIVFGATAVIFAAGLSSSLIKVTSAQAGTTLGEASVSLANNGPMPPGSKTAQKALAIIRTQRGTANYAGQATAGITVAGMTKQVSAVAFDGSSSWIGLDMITGHWIDGLRQADVNTAFLAQTGLSVGDKVPIALGGKHITVRIAGEVFDPQGQDQPAFFTSWQTLGGALSGPAITQYDIGIQPGTDRVSYANALGQTLGAKYSVNTITRGFGFELTAGALSGLLTLLLAVSAGLGVLNTVLLATRERVHDLGVFKALGMTPRQMISMVVCWVIVPAAVAAVIAAPLAVFLHSVTLQAAGQAGGTGIPANIARVYSVPELALLALSALAIALIGALAPASWAARSGTAIALRAE